MTITFSIHNDKDESVVETYPCYQCDACMQDEHLCTSPTTFKSSKWQMNVANGNASLILNSLGLGLSDNAGSDGKQVLVRFIREGSANPNALLKAINRTSVDLLVRETVANGNVFNCGIDRYRAASYLDKLREIAVEAARREDDVVWG